MCPCKNGKVTTMRNDLITPEYGPLHGMRVMLSGSALAGPWTARMMGDYGAEVIKIETPKVGDTSRSGPAIHPALFPNGTLSTETP